VALAVADIQEARAELDRLGVKYWLTEGVVGPQSQQIFMHDPAGNMIELHQADTCRCVTARRPATASAAMR
jgi:catechol 2,3-dioxygenase-like lactoylglutathione lyase family enzyme